MKTRLPTPAKKQVLKQVATNLFRSNVTGVYYAIFKRKRRQVKRSLKTKNRQIAQHKLDEIRHKLARLKTGDAKSLRFAEYDGKGVLIGGLAKRWLNLVGLAIEESTRDRYLDNIKELSSRFNGMTVNSITAEAAEQWATGRRPNCSKSTYRQDRDVLDRILQFGVDQHLLLENAACHLPRPEPDTNPPQIPSSSDTSLILATMRRNGGHRSADLVEVLRRSGCRLSEVVGNKKYGKEPMRWRDIDFGREFFRVGRSKNHQGRIVPMSKGFATFLRQLWAQSPVPPQPDDRIIAINSARKSLQTACDELGLPRCGHHTWRHSFCSLAITKNVPTKAVAALVGHQDGGVLVSKTYTHLVDEYLAEMAQRITFDDQKPDPSTNTINTN